MARVIIAILAVITIATSIFLSWPKSGAASISMFPQLDLPDLQVCLRQHPREAMLYLSGRCQGDWRSLAEPARHVWVTLFLELTDTLLDNQSVPTAAEITAAYAAMGLEGLNQSPTSLRSHHAQILAARERYVATHASDFVP